MVVRASMIAPLGGAPQQLAVEPLVDDHNPANDSECHRSLAKYRAVPVHGI